MAGAKLHLGIVQNAEKQNVEKNAKKKLTTRQMTKCQNKRQKKLSAFFTKKLQNVETMLDDVSGVLTMCNDRQY